MDVTYASPTADAAFASVKSTTSQGLVNSLVRNINGWTVFLTILIGCVAYDQSESPTSSSSFPV